MSDARSWRFFLNRSFAPLASTINGIDSAKQVKYLNYLLPLSSLLKSIRSIDGGFTVVGLRSSAALFVFGRTFLAAAAAAAL